MGLASLKSIQQAKKKHCPIFFDPSNHPTGFSTHMSDLTSSESIQQAKSKILPFFFTYPTIQWGVFENYVPFFLVIQRSNRGFHTYIKPGLSEIDPTGQKKNTVSFFLTH